jgi:hypothetical protein
LRRNGASSSVVLAWRNAVRNFTITLALGALFSLIASVALAPPAHALRCLKVLGRQGNYIICGNKVYRVPSRIPGKFAPETARRTRPVQGVRAPYPTAATGTISRSVQPTHLGRGAGGGRRR